MERMPRTSRRQCPRDPCNATDVHRAAPGVSVGHGSGDLPAALEEIWECAACQRPFILTKPESRHEGHTLRVAAAAGDSLTVHTGETFTVGPYSEGHDGHPQIKVGDVLTVAKDSAPNGDTLVRLSCRCQLLLLSD